MHGNDPYPLVGRRHETTLIDGLIGDLAENRSALVIVEGGAGAGKTALLNYVVEATRRHGVRVLFTSGGHQHPQQPLGAVRELLEPGRVSVPPAVPGSGPEELFAGLHEHVRHLTDEGPLALVVDDVHRIDHLSLGWLAHLARRLSGIPLLLVASVSTGERPASRESYDDLRNTLNRTEIHLSPLGQEDVERLLGSYRQTPPSPQFAALCRQLTGGNPRFTHDLARLLDAEGVTMDEESAGLLPGLAPPRTAQYISDRLARHSTHSLDVAKVLAVLGGGARPTLVRELCGFEGSVCADTIQSLTELGLLRAGGTVAFVHPIVRTALYRCMRTGERSRHHLTAAKVLAARNGDASLIGRHLLAAAPTTDPEITDLLCDVAVRLASTGDLEQSTACLQRAIQSSLSPVHRAKLTLQLGVALGGYDARASIRHLRHASTGVRTSAEHALIGQHLALATAALGDLDGAISVLDEHVGLLDGQDPTLSRRLRGYRMILETLHAGPAGREWGPAASATDSGARAALATRLAWRGEDLERSIREAETAPATGRSVGAGSLVTSFSLLPLVYADRLDTVERQLLDAEQHLPAVQVPELAVLRSHVALRRGDVAQAEVAARAAVAAVADGLPEPVLFHHLATLVDVLLERGEHEEAADLLRQAGLPHEPPGTWRHNHLLDSRGRLRIACGDLRAGVEDLLACGERLARWGVANPAVSMWRSAAALALDRLGDGSRARTIAREQVVAARAWPAGRSLGGSLRTLALLTPDPRKRVTILREAVQILEKSPAALELGRAVVELGTALAEADQEGEARDMLRRGLDLAQRCGGTALADHAHAELVRYGARPRRRAQTGWAALTPAEKRVAQLVVDGRKNREIAQLLFVSQRTVELHLTNIYRKLNVSSRVALVKAG
ncbi:MULTISPECIES: ATP-binding protein [Streptosporangium]|uniref:DNA-binding CsgD family transcriptional regulator n=1 Tax=Streptosporangium brasiliense TaxID=47480 RepID=A0ABT9QWR7_9ACTN|nr:LuxR family transcriptional regulator [Streptosporangium brasiliense]MDP9861413.1 DNA-binding CsgD family transcriptional regulator [Streptosporangium brasiliense]